MNIHRFMKLSEYAPELYEALKGLLEAIPIIAGDSRHDELSMRIFEADKLIREIDKDKPDEKFNQKLKLCPFCGGETEVYQWAYIKCQKCGTKTNGYLRYSDAIKAWNRRAGE